jgi:hypothetical protein
MQDYSFAFIPEFLIRTKEGKNNTQKQKKVTNSRIEVFALKGLQGSF